MRKVISEHLFVFPFSWKQFLRGGSPLFDQHHQLKGKRFGKLGHWQEKLSMIKTPEDYNEYVYFYKPIRAALYTFSEKPVIVRNYIYEPLDQNGVMRLEIGENSYDLKISSIDLKLYKTGIGLLCFKFYNTLYNEAEVLKVINRFSECVYPPVLPIEKASANGYPSKVTLFLNKNTCIVEDFSKIKIDKHIMLSPLIMDVLGKPFISHLLPDNKEHILIEPILGHQMFCCCMYYAPQYLQLENEEEALQLLKKWMIGYEQLSPIQEEAPYLLMTKDHIYGIDRKMVFGITASYPCERLYDQLVKLVLMQRATLLSLSTEIARVSTLPKCEISAAISSIYEIYIQFINQLYFKEVTEDSEGSLLYEQLSQNFKISEELEQLNFEMDEVHEYASLVEQSASNLKVQILTIIGAALVLPSFVTGFFGMNIFHEEAPHWWRHASVALWLNSYVFFPILVVVALCMWTQRRTTLSRIFKVILSLLLLTSLSFTIKYGCGL